MHYAASKVACTFSCAALLVLFTPLFSAPRSDALNCLGLQALRELRADTAVAYPEQRKLQIAPEQVRHSPFASNIYRQGVPLDYICVF